MTLASSAANLARRAAALRRPPPAVRAVLAVVGVVIFIAIAWWAVDDYRQRGLDANVWLLATAALIGTPLAVWLNGLELMVLSRATGQEPSMSQASAVSLMASCANVLPLPGSILVRTWFLARGPRGLKAAVSVQAIAGVTFVGVTAAVVGVLLVAASPWAAAGLIVFGTATCVVAAKVAGWRLVARLIRVEAAMAASEIGRYLVVLHALGLGARFDRAAPLVLANVLSTVVGVFPAGLGVREVLSGLLSYLSDLEAALAVTTSAADRMATTLVLGVMFALASVTGWRQRHLHDLGPVGAAS